MRPRLMAHALRQHGLVTRNQALRSGYSASEVRALTGRGTWHTVRRGVYAERTLWEQFDRDEMDRRRILAVFLQAEQPLYASHGSGGLLQHLALLEVSRRRIHMTAPRIDAGRGENGVVYHPARVSAVDTTTTPFGPVTSVARTVCDIARYDGYDAGIVAADRALRDGLPREELERVVSGMRNWPGVRAVRAVVEDADQGAENPGESLHRVVISRLGWGRPRLQVRVTDGGRTAYVDAMLGCHAFEFDGFGKYARAQTAETGDAPASVVFEEKRREDWLRSRPEIAGLSRSVWDEVWEEVRCAGEGPLLRRFRTQVDATIARVGMAAWMSSLDSSTRV
ncbi:type IV toxin-antitoxin system AbiEi family antitoxin domain-containing protein [Nocardioidaceae bacterium]|nr:type IV toxin-antitoxin system AbiEi family antitoxin domain-containing protein [Nocardioidaceae bacterium]